MAEKSLRQIPLTSLFVALAIIFPMFFHMFGLGSTFLPMFLPVIVGSMLLTWRFALMLGIISPVSSWLLTGMPPIVPPILPVMVVELTIISIIVSLLKVHLKQSVWIALIAAIVADRVVLYILVSVIAPIFGIDSPLFTTAIVLSGLPGIALQLITIPLLMKLIKEKIQS